MKSFDEFLLHASCTGFVVGAVTGLFVGVWCSVSLFGSEAVTDLWMLAALGMLGLCVWQVFRMAEKEGMKK